MPHRKPLSRPKRFARDLADTLWQASLLLTRARAFIIWPLTCWDDLLALPPAEGLPGPLQSGIAAGLEVRRLLEDFARRWQLPGPCLPALFEALDLGPEAWTGKILPFVVTGRTGDSQADPYKALEAKIEQYLRWRLTVLQARDTAGRPAGSGAFASQDEFLTALAEAIQALRQQRRPVTQENVADYFARALPSRRLDQEAAISDRTVRFWLDSFGLSWSEAVELAEKIPPGEFTS